MTIEKIKTGTTCIGLKFKDGVILAADKRVTSYRINTEKFSKVFNISENIVTTVSGGVADAQRLVKTIQSELKLLSLKAERMPYVNEAAMILTDYQYSIIRSSGGVVGMLVGGFDEKDGFSLYELSPEGSVIDCEDYFTNGSGSIFVEGILSTEFKENLSKKDAISLIEKCFKASFKNDNASGGGFIIKVITKSGIEEVERKVIESKFIDEK